MRDGREGQRCLGVVYRVDMRSLLLFLSGRYWVGRELNKRLSGAFGRHDRLYDNYDWASHEVSDV